MYLLTDGHRDCGRVQDPYTMRCVPQVHGIVRDTIEFVQRVITTEMNSALDNPVSVTKQLEVSSPCTSIVCMEEDVTCYFPEGLTNLSYNKKGWGVEFNKYIAS